MSTVSKIQWTDRTWNPVRGCSLVSPGCTNCYAMKQAHRFSGEGRAYEGLTRMTEHGPVWSSEVRTIDDALEEPLRWRKPARVFVNSMSDLFAVGVPFEFIDAVFAVMALAREHTFQILTKRPHRMRDYLLGIQDDDKDMQRWVNAAPAKHPCAGATIEHRAWPLPNVHLGASVENQETADERIPVLLETPAAVRFLSVEPMLERIHFPHLALSHTLRKSQGKATIDWVIVGGESGPNARPCNVDWIRGVVQQCRGAGVPVFVKQLGASPYSTNREDYSCRPIAMDLRDYKGGDIAEWPEDLRIREFPAV